MIAAMFEIALLLVAIFLFVNFIIWFVGVVAGWTKGTIDHAKRVADKLGDEDKE